MKCSNCNEEIIDIAMEFNLWNGYVRFDYCKKCRTVVLGDMKEIGYTFSKDTEGKMTIKKD